MADMEEEKRYHSCGLVINPLTGEKEVVALPGGFNPRIEIYNIAEDTWRPGPDFPQTAYYVSAAQDGRNSFFALGGFAQSVILDTIYRFDEETYEFVLLEKRLPYEAARAFGMMVSQNNVS